MKQKYCKDCKKPVWRNSIRCKSCNALFRKKENHPSWKGGWKNKLPNCKICNKKLSHKTHKYCVNCFNTKVNIGNNNYLWMGGKTKRGYTTDFIKKIRYKIINRDKSCMMCGLNNVQLSVHHIDYNKQNNNSDNLISLCRRCHSITNHNRNRWLKYFIYFMKNKDKTTNNIHEYIFC